MDLSTLTYKQIRDVAVNQDFQAKLAIAIAADDDDATLKQTVLGIWNAFAGVG